jgi:pimeloyl-ACP methyl ester carboxylesterase
LVEKGFAATNLIALGESLGCAVATELACRQTLGGLILQSGFTSVPDLGAELFPWLPVRQIGRIRYDTRSKLPRLTVPVLILHSPDDELIGFHHAQRNYAVAREPKWLWELRGGHNDALWVDRARFRAGLEMFLARFAEGTNPRPRMTHNE